jgi:hypothetical protein
MDIEGAEYDVLEKMVKDGSIYYVNELYIEWHSFKIDSISDERHHALCRLLGMLVNLKSWNK